MMQHMGFKIIVLGIVVLGLMMGTVLPAVAVRAQERFGYAYAHRDCAPWDGAAWRIVIQDKPVIMAVKAYPKSTFPNYSIYLWLSDLPSNKWLKLPAEHKGNITWCSAPNTCEQKTGRVTLTQKSANRLDGELRMNLPDRTGREIVFPFQAQILDFSPFCG